MPSWTAVSLRGRVSGWSGTGPRPAVRAPAAAPSLPARSAQVQAEGAHSQRGQRLAGQPRAPLASGGRGTASSAGARRLRGAPHRQPSGALPAGRVRERTAPHRSRSPSAACPAGTAARPLSRPCHTCRSESCESAPPPGCRVSGGTAEVGKHVPKKKAPRAHDKREEQQVLRLRQPALALGQRCRPTKLATGWLRCRRLHRRRPAHQGRGPSSTAPLMSGSSPSALPDASMPAASSRDAACVCSWSGISPCRRPTQRPCHYTGRLGITGGSSASW